MTRRTGVESEEYEVSRDRLCVRTCILRRILEGHQGDRRLRDGVYRKVKIEGGGEELVCIFICTRPTVRHITTLVYTEGGADATLEDLPSPK